MADTQIAEDQSSAETSTSKIVTLRIAKSNPEKDSVTKFESFQVSYERWTTVLDAILDVKKHLDHSVAVRYSCRQATCGSCGMKINGRPRLACFTKISELDSDVVTVEPMSNYPIVRDLVVDLEKMFDTHKEMKPFMVREDTEITPNSRELLQTPEQVEEYIQFANCIKCGLCNSACPTMATDSSFLGRRRLHKHTDMLQTVGTRAKTRD
ncbi:2Fe-2S iron-sulfur cluster-binding protein [Candidatus Nitrosotenuis chungbukensis]|nr:2Fe-2S iron-sulfur cluster-binding protein [Candidatus Nitrosotenuis chungbukensis]